MLSDKVVLISGVGPGLGLQLGRAAVHEVAKSFPLGGIRTDGQSANAVLFLLSDLAAAITGASLDVNGGEWMTP